MEKFCEQKKLETAIVLMGMGTLMGSYRNLLSVNGVNMLILPF